MYYEIDVNGKKIRPLPGYFEGFKNDLAGVDESLLSETQKDYISIPNNKIIEVNEEEHQLILEQKAENERKLSNALQYLSGTDYKIIKEMETGEVCPEEVKLKRAECRTIINELQGA